VENSYGLNNLVDLIEIVQVLFKKIFLKWKLNQIKIIILIRSF
jgi:hypothetical protein